MSECVHERKRERECPSESRIYRRKIYGKSQREGARGGRRTKRSTEGKSETGATANACRPYPLPSAHSKLVRRVPCRSNFNGGRLRLRHLQCCVCQVIVSHGRSIGARAAPTYDIETVRVDRGLSSGGDSSRAVLCVAAVATAVVATTAAAVTAHSWRSVSLLAHPRSSRV